MDVVINRVNHDMVSSSEKFRVFRKYHAALNGFAVEMTEATADKVTNLFKSNESNILMSCNIHFYYDL